MERMKILGAGATQLKDKSLFVFHIVSFVEQKASALNWSFEIQGNK